MKGGKGRRKIVCVQDAADSEYVLSMHAQDLFLNNFIVSLKLTILW